MGGGTIECGEFMGEDKTGSALDGVFKSIEAFLSGTALADWQEKFMASLEESAEEQAMIIPAASVPILMTELNRAYDALYAKHGHVDSVDPYNVAGEEGLDPLEAKWGAGEGFRYYCIYDLLEACKVSQTTGDPIYIYFD